MTWEVYYEEEKRLGKDKVKFWGTLRSDLQCDTLLWLGYII